MAAFVAFYRGKQIDVVADTSYAAQLAAAKTLKARKSYDVTIVAVNDPGASIT